METIDVLIERPPLRQLRARWSMEAMQDLRTIHNIDAERELASILAAEIQREIDREIIRDLGIPMPEIPPMVDIEFTFEPIRTDLWTWCREERGYEKVNWLKEGF